MKSTLKTWEKTLRLWGMRELSQSLYEHDAMMQNKGDDLNE